MGGERPKGRENGEAGKGGCLLQEGKLEPSKGESCHSTI